MKCVHIIFWKCTKDKSVIWGFIRWNNTMEGVSVRWYLENTGIQTFLPHGNGLLFAKNNSLPLDRTWKDRLLRHAGGSRLRYGTCISRLTVISLRNSVKMFLQSLHMEWGLPTTLYDSVRLTSADILLQRFLSASSNVKPGTANLPQTGWAYLLFPHLPYCLPTRWESKKYPLGKPKSLKQKGK